MKVIVGIMAVFAFIFTIPSIYFVYKLYQKRAAHKNNDSHSQQNKADPH